MTRWRVGVMVSCVHRENTMTRDEVLHVLRQHRRELDPFGVTSLALFGSVARNEASDRSDVDLLVEFGGPARFDHFMDLKFHLEAILGRPVDLVTRSALKPRLRPIVEREAVPVT